METAKYIGGEWVKGFEAHTIKELKNKNEKFRKILINIYNLKVCYLNIPERTLKMH